MDERANAADRTCISVPGSAPGVWVIPTDEEPMIAMPMVAVLWAEQILGEENAG
jgi:acetate kinase